MSTYRFTCPDCGARVEVDAGARERLLAAGCPVCGAAVGTAAFTVANTFGTSV